VNKNLKKFLGYANLALGLICFLGWLWNTLGWIDFGNRVAELIMAPICFILGAMLLQTSPQSK
jgi:hypothetical protein